MDLTLWEQIELSAPTAIKLINLLFAGVHQLMGSNLHADAHDGVVFNRCDSIAQQKKYRFFIESF